MSRNLPVKTHAELGASSAHRWMRCPGSVRMSRGMPDYETDYAREGTAAHALAELCLRNNTETSAYIGLTLEGIEVTEDMAGFVGVFVDYCRRLQEQAAGWWVERQFSLAPLNPPAAMFGTADFVAYMPQRGVLEVVDLKYGQGVTVEVRNNPQLRYYALGAVLSFDTGDIPLVEAVNLTVVQPRVSHPDGVIRSEQIALPELLDFSGELLAAARATLDPEAPLVPGSHCRFCPAAGVCPAQFEAATSIAQVEFAALPADVPPDPETLPAEILADILHKLPILEDWAVAVRQAAAARLERGEAVPGFKAVAKRATRKWASEAEARRWLAGRGYDPEEYEERKLKSPAAVERMMGPAKKELPDELIVKQSSGFNVVPESDPRPALALGPEHEFKALPRGDED